MRKLSVFLILAVVVAYFFMFPEDHAADLPFDGLTVGDPLELEQALATGLAASPDPAETDGMIDLGVDPLGHPDLVTPSDLPADQDLREALDLGSSLGTGETADDLGSGSEIAHEDGSPSALPGDLASDDGYGIPISGRVIDATGEAVPGVRVRVEHPYLPEVLGSSSTDGSFHLTPTDLRGNLALATTSWVLLGGRLALENGVTEGYLIVIAEPVILHGTVVDDAGEPLDGARIHGFAPSDTLVPFGTPALPLDHEAQHGTSNARGKFRIGPVPLLAGTRIEVHLDGYETVTVGLPADPRQPIEAVLQRY